MVTTQRVADHDAPITLLKVTDKFELLTDSEQKYAHYMSAASHAGTRVVLRQVSHESEAIFDLILGLHRDLHGEYPRCNETGLYLDYVTQFLANLGNYKSFGDSKFVPGCTKQYFYKLLELAKWDLNGSPRCHCPFASWKELIEDGIYKVEGKGSLGYTSDGFTSSYYMGEPISQMDMALLKHEVFGPLSILPENIRINKVSNDSFEIWVASTAKAKPLYEATTLSNGVKVSFKFGDHSREMQCIVESLEHAKEFAANTTQKKMLKWYIEHFKTGSGQAHKESQKLWVKDISPTIETNIGFIETYREPSGVIGEFESLVAIQNKERTEKFSQLVNNAQEFISLLPWTADWEKPVFNPPDFTSIEVLTFTGSGIPAGINIPNYDDVRINIGFKNVSLGNILSASAKSSSKHPPSFISDQDRPIYEKWQGDSFEVQVGIHELLGHGSGKLLCEVEDGFNFDEKNPPLGLDGTPVTTYYKFGETWGSKFGAMAGPFEECRAEVIAMYLITNRKILDIFGFNTKQDQDDVIYAGYLQMCRAGLMALEFWDPNTSKWGQPHMQARFSIMKTFLKHSPDPAFLSLITDADQIIVKLERSLIETAGHECIKDYLKHLHIYKCSGDYERGSQYFNDRCTVTADLAKLRDTVISKRLPRRQFIQTNTRISNYNKVVLQEYEETPKGMLESFIERQL